MWVKRKLERQGIICELSQKKRDDDDVPFTVKVLNKPQTSFIQSDVHGSLLSG